MTQDEFNLLPGTLTRKEFMRATGFTWRTLAKLLESGGLKTFKPAGARQNRYLKSEAARVAGWQL